VLGITMHKRTQIAELRHAPSYKLEVKYEPNIVFMRKS